MVARHGKVIACFRIAFVGSEFQLRWRGSFIPRFAKRKMAALLRNIARGICKDAVRKVVLLEISSGCAFEFGNEGRASIDVLARWRGNSGAIVVFRDDFVA